MKLTVLGVSYPSKTTPRGGQVADHSLDVVHLEVGHRLTQVRLAAPHGELRFLSRAEAKSNRRLVEQRQALPTSPVCHRLTQSAGVRLGEWWNEVSLACRS